VAVARSVLALAELTATPTMTASTITRDAGHAIRFLPNFMLLLQS